MPLTVVCSTWASVSAPSIMPVLSLQSAPGFLDLLLLETVLPDGHERRDTIVAVVEQHDPVEDISISSSFGQEVRYSHSVRIHAFADQELVILEIADDLLRV